MKPAAGIQDANLQTMDAIFSEMMNAPRLTKDTALCKADLELTRVPWVPMSAEESHAVVEDAMRCYKK